MRLFFKFNVLLISLLVSACMQSTGEIRNPGVPAWVYEEPGNYPNVKYLSATGSASKAEQAKARALSNLAKIFEVQIREVSTTREDVTSNQVDDLETVNKSMRIDSTVNLQTDKIVHGARVVEQWQNNADLTYHALAVLERAQAGNNIRAEMRRLDEETRYSMNQYVTRDDILLKISDLQKANALQQDRQSLQNTLKIIDLNGMGMPSEWRPGELEGQLQQALRSMALQTAVRDDDIGGLNALLQGAASVSGFTVSDIDKLNNYLLSASLESQSPIRKDGWFWLRATLSIDLSSQNGASVIGQKSWPLKVSAGNLDQLKPRMRKSVENTLNKELLSSLLEFLR